MRLDRCGRRGGRGFTLIEVMIASAVLVILIGAVFAVNFRITDLWASERGRSQIQQNFRFASDMLTVDLRQAIAVYSPSDKAMEDTLRFDYRDGWTGGMMRATYQRAGTGPYRVTRTVQSLVWDGSKQLWQASGSPSVQLVTEDIPSLAAIHFLRSGNRVVTILVAEYRQLGKTQQISYVLETVVRNLGASATY
jgi:prepilin-type N-terminal cleavage/methylation domain-containing protein